MSMNPTTVGQIADLVTYIVKAGLVCIALYSGCLVVFVFFIYAPYTHFANKKVRRALEQEQRWRQEQQVTNMRLAETHTTMQKEENQLHLARIWNSLFELQYALYGTTREAEENRWEQYVQYGHTLPPLFLPDEHRQLHGEMVSIMSLLMHLGTMVDGGRIFPCDLAAVEQSIDNLAKRFKQFKREQREQRYESYNVLFDLRSMREEHERFSNHYCLTRFNSAFQHFPGMIHALEGMLEDEQYSVPYARSYVCALRKQLDLLKSQFESGLI